MRPLVRPNTSLNFMEFITFKIHPDYPKRLKDWYYKVYIFKRRASMYQFRDTLNEDGANPMKKPHKYYGLCSSFPSKKNPKQFGVIMFCTGSSKQSGVVSHELTHATTYWWKSIFHKDKKMKNIFGDSKADEQYAWVLGNLVAQYWRIWYTIKK
jgi:hypothetical protein